MIVPHWCCCQNEAYFCQCNRANPQAPFVECITCVYDPVEGVVCNGELYPGITPRQTPCNQQPPCVDLECLPPGTSHPCCCYAIPSNNWVSCIGTQNACASHNTATVQCFPKTSPCGGLFELRRGCPNIQGLCPVCLGNPPTTRTAIVSGAYVCNPECECCEGVYQSIVNQINGSHTLVGGQGCAWSKGFVINVTGCDGDPGCPTRGCGSIINVGISYSITGNPEGVMGQIAVQIGQLGAAVQHNFGPAPANCGGFSANLFQPTGPCTGTWTIQGPLSVSVS